MLNVRCCKISELCPSCICIGVKQFVSFELTDRPWTVQLQDHYSDGYRKLVKDIADNVSEIFARKDRLTTNDLDGLLTNK